MGGGLHRAVEGHDGTAIDHDVDELLGLAGEGREVLRKLEAQGCVLLLSGVEVVSEGDLWHIYLKFK